LSLLLRLAPRGRHLAFEPLPQKAAWLRRKFPEVEVHAAALGASSGEVSFVENLTRSSFSGLRARPGATDVTREITVRCERLDDVLGVRVDFLKADVEGAELMVLQGAAGVQRRDRPALVFESGPGGAERFGYGRMDLYNYLKGLGYYIYLFKDYLAGGPPLSPGDFDAAHAYPFAAFNYVAVTSP
jgi:FkbM family methyltransferase